MKTKEHKFGQTPIETSPMTKAKEEIAILERKKMGTGLYLITFERWTGCRCSAKKDSVLMKSNRIPTAAKIRLFVGL